MGPRDEEVDRVELRKEERWRVGWVYHVRLNLAAGSWTELPPGWLLFAL